MIWVESRQLVCEASACRLHCVLTFRFIFPVESIHNIIQVNRNPKNQVSIVRFTSLTQDRCVVDIEHIKNTEIKIHTRLMCHVKSYRRIQDPSYPRSVVSKILQLKTIAARPSSP